HSPPSCPSPSLLLPYSDIHKDFLAIIVFYLRLQRYDFFSNSQILQELISNTPRVIGNTPREIGNTPREIGSGVGEMIIFSAPVIFEIELELIF
ncbi:MAG: hypothetical protein II390_00675, partial [Prevotella sp.]|nr:hypothetical protein [Prevotella sp.]